MRLLQRCDAGYLRLTSELHDDIPPYAILSHTWGKDDEEVSFLDIEKDCERRKDGWDGQSSYNTKAGYRKLDFCLKQALKDGLHYAWVDTCCIDKRDLSGLARAINSMYKWYKDSKKCYVFLDEEITERKRGYDGCLLTDPVSRLRHSRWITRGWTLQELLAPADVQFYTRDSQSIGNKHDLAFAISHMTGIHIEALQGAPLKSFSVKERFQWAHSRKTKYPEDKAYCLLGIFDVSLPLVPAESEKQAMFRLEEAIAGSFRLDLRGDSNEARTLPTETRDNKRQRNLERGEEAQKAARGQLRESMHDSLGYHDMNTRRDIITTPFSSTCRWILEHDMYKRWSQTHEHWQDCFLWIKGKPGTGKSTILKLLDVHAANQTETYDHRISFYFNARGDKMQQSVIGMYRSLLWQLLYESADLQEVVLQAMNFNADALDQSEYWSVGKLQTAFSRTLHKLSDKKVICFVDALDECDEKEVREMLQYFSDLIQESWRTDSPGRLWICFASRHYPAIHVDTELQLILENEKEHDTDIELYVQRHLKTGSGTASEGIQVELVRKANGIFMWAVLVVGILNDVLLAGKIYKVRKTLDDLPAELDALFRDIIVRDGGRNMDSFRLCVQWLLFAQRPLGRDEFYWALATSLGEATDDWTASSLLNEEYMTRHVSNCSMGLAELAAGDRPIVHFIHESVRDFLLKGNGLREIWPGDEDIETIECQSHEVIKTACHKCLKAAFSEDLDLLLGKSSVTTRFHSRDALSEKLVLLAYSRQNLFYHAEQAAAKLSQAQFISTLDTQGLIRINNIYERYDDYHLSDRTALTTLLAIHNVPQLIRVAFEVGHAPHRADQPYEALYFALVTSSYEAAQALLTEYDMPDAHDLIGELPDQGQHTAMALKYNRNPLLWCLGYDHEALAFTLSSSEPFTASMTSRDTWDALRAAVEKGSYRLVKCLLTCFTKFVKPRLLIYAAERGNTDAVRALIEHGIDVNTKDDHSATALTIAAKHSELSELLRAAGAKDEAEPDLIDLTNSPASEEDEPAQPGFSVSKVTRAPQQQCESPSTVMPAAKRSPRPERRDAYPGVQDWWEYRDRQRSLSIHSSDGS